ncbi:DsbA family oxidoreductase [Yersinia sp. 2540 StPb PI]|uniref:DsbA family oxidoreductase n=1 Tax=Yersinia sp. 2540 StPb PI TaxID=3117406 RepID=UPI003FA48E1A
MKILKPRLTIDIWSDLVCPWCWIAKKRFEQGLALFEFRDQVEIRHHSFRLAGGSQTLPFRDAIRQKLGNQHSADSMMSQVETAGKSEGLVYNFSTMLFGDTEDAHTLLTAAREVGIGDAVEERLYRGSITEGRSIFDRQELVALAVEAGMAKTEAEVAFENDAFRVSVAKDEAHARSIGVSGVPIFVMNEKYGISGAQSADSFLNALRQVWEEQQTDLSDTTSQTCGTGGCSI